MNPFLRKKTDFLDSSRAVRANLAALCAVGIASTLSVAVGQSIPAPVEDPAVELDSATGGVTPEPLVQGFPTVPGDPDPAVSAGPESVMIPMTDGVPAVEDASAVVPEEEPVQEPLDGNWFFGPGDFNPVFGVGPAVNGGWGGFSDPNRGFSTGFGGYPVGMNPYYRILDGLSLSATLSGFYDTNPSMGYSDPSNDGEGDFAVTLGGGISYQTAGGEWTFGGSYNVGYTEYFSQSDLSGFSQGASVFAAYAGGPLSVTTTLGMNFGSGPNRYYDSVVDELSLSLSVAARYQYSPITSFAGYFSTGLILPGGNDYEDTNAVSFGGSVLWRYSPLLEFGPGFAVTMNSGDFQEDRVSYGPTMTVNYKVTNLISLSGQFGLDFVDYEDSGTEGPDFSCSIVANYQPSTIWGMSLALGRGVQVDPGQAGSFNETTYVRLGYNRNLPWATWNVGVTYEHMNEEVPDETIIATRRGDRDFISIDSSLSMPIFADTCMGSLFVRFSDQDSSGDAGSWDSFMTGFSISRSF